MKKLKKLVLFDGHALLHRGFHAIPYLSTKDGTPTNGVYGFTTMMLKALRELKPDYVAVGWDMPGKTFRDKLYKDYKGTRAKIDDALVAQIPITREVIKAFNVPLVEMRGYEADDVIGSLAKKYSKDVEVIIVTGDMDELQLVSDRVSVYTMRRGFTDTVLFDSAKVKEKYGVTPEQFVDFKALKGDTSDNIPGVTGIGEKTATDLVVRFGSVQGIYDHLAELTPKQQEIFKSQKKTAFLSRQLSAIKTDIKPTFDLKDAEIDGYNRAKVYELFSKLEFRSLLSKLPGASGIEVPAQGDLFAQGQADISAINREHLKKAKYHLVNDDTKFQDLVSQLKKQKVFAFDTETDSLDFINVELVGMSFSFKESEAYYIPVGHNEGKQLSREQVLQTLTPILENPKIGKVGHNIKFDYQVMKRYNIQLGLIVFDTMVAAFLINPIVRALTLSDLAFNELGISMIEITELIGPRGKNQTTFDQTNINEATQYAAEDADISWRLYKTLSKQLEKIPRLTELAEAMEWPLIPVLGDMEITGVKLDIGFLEKFGKEINAKLSLIEEDIWEIAGERFNISSTQQLKMVLFDKLKIQNSNLKKIKTGISTAASELEKLRGAHPIIDLLFEYREVSKLKTTYVDALPLLVNKTTGRIHTSYNQTIAQTGRLSSTNPNLQNIPIRNPLGAEIRKAFVADRGKVFVSADYSQIELRLAAALAHDTEMIEAFKGGADIHELTAAQLYGVDPKQITKEQRYAAKTINFGILYGMNPHGLSVATGMDHDQAKDFIARYFELRKGVADYIKKLKDQAHKDNYTETIFGRRRPCPDIHSSNFVVRSASERAAVNMPLQGTAADMMKLTMIKIADQLPDGADIILQIHDELIVECQKTQANQVAKIMKLAMENIHKFSVPIEAATSVGKDWGALD